MVWGSMIDAPPFRDLERSLVEWLATLDELVTGVDGTVHVDVRTHSDLLDTLPFVRVSVWDGDDDRVTDRLRVDIDTFTADRDPGYALAEKIRALLNGAPCWVGVEGAKVFVDRVETLSRPSWAPWDGASSVHRRLASYELSARR
jgi:hypothetical protein